MLMAQMHHGFFYFSMPNMDACSDTRWQFEDLFLRWVVSPFLPFLMSSNGYTIPRSNGSERFSCGEIRGNKFI